MSCLAAIDTETSLSTKRRLPFFLFRGILFLRKDVKP